MKTPQGTFKSVASPVSENEHPPAAFLNEAADALL